MGNQGQLGILERHVFRDTNPRGFRGSGHRVQVSRRNLAFESLRAVSNVYELELSDRYSSASSYTQMNPIYVRVYIFGYVFTL